MKATHRFTHPDVKYTLEWDRMSGKYRTIRGGIADNWTDSGYTKKEIESCGWKCHTISFENK